MKWGLDLSKMVGISTDDAYNNKKAFANYSWIPCFGHNLHLAVGKALGLNCVSKCLSRRRTTVSAFSRSSKMQKSLKQKQESLSFPELKLIHDEPTCWNSTFEMVERFCEQQQAVCAVWAENRRKWHLMSKDTDMATLEIIREGLEPVSKKKKRTWKVYCPFEKRESGEAGMAEGGASFSPSPSDHLSSEYLLYKQIKEISATEDPLTWWKNHEAALPILAYFTRKHLCIPAKSCASERVFSTSDIIYSPRRMRLTKEHIDMLFFLAKMPITLK